MFGADLLLKTLSPAKGFALIRHHLEGSLKKNLESFDIIFNATDKEVDFVVYHTDYKDGGKTFPYPGGAKFVGVALGILKEKLPPEAKDAAIDKAVATYRPEGITGYLFYTENGIKQPPVIHKF